LARYHPGGDIPIPIEEIIDLHFRIDIVPTPGLHEGFGIDAFITSDQSTIYVDEFLYTSRPGRYRFSLAHELGHHTLHAPIFQGLKFASIEEWITTITSIPEKEYGWLEWQAYAFAGLVLVPKEPLVESFGRLAAHLDSVGLSLQTASDAAKFMIAKALAEEFSVSTQVIEKRVQKEGLWT
jgi:Zn-dependent peptidase ImmA (M78 family)